jgi:DNA modification methylase
LNHTVSGDAVYDPFLGSGTTVIAAEQTGRVCYGIDVDPKYVDIIVKRWQDFTGLAATLDGDGRTFADITYERLDAVSS